MAVSVDWPNRNVLVPKADTLLDGFDPVSGRELRSLDTDFFRTSLRDLEDDTEGRAFPRTHDYQGPVTIGGVTLAPVISMINNFTVEFEDGTYRVRLNGSNSNIADVSVVNQVQVVPTNSAGQTFSSEINLQSFSNASVYLDANDGQAGTQFPRGTPTDPVDNLTDALTIASSNGLHRISLRGFITATSSHDLDGMEITGDSGAQNIVILSGASTINSSFERIIVAGEQKGLSRMVNCIIGATGLGGLTGAEGRYVNSVVNSSAGVQQRSDGAGTLFDNCAFVAPNDPQIILDANGKGWGLRRCTGRILVQNQTIAEQLQVHVTGAHIEFDASCTAGTVIVDGYGEVTDNSDPGCSVVSDGLFNAGENIEGALTREDMLRIILSAVAGSGGPQSGTQFAYKSLDNSKDRITADVSSSGVRSNVTVDGS